MTVVYIFSVAFFMLWIVVGVAIKPGKKRMDRLPTKWYAHRGLHDALIPENSMSAFLKAKDAEIGIELDVRLSKDRQVLVFHDDNMKRMCGVDKQIERLTYAKISKYRLSNTDEKIPLLIHVLKKLQTVPLIIEIKTGSTTFDETICKKVADAIKTYQGPCFVESFNPYVIRWFKIHAPHVLRGQLSLDFQKTEHHLKPIQAFLLKHLLVNCIAKPDFVAYRVGDRSLGLSLVRWLYDPICIAWTIQNQRRMDFLHDMYDGYIFEDIEWIKAEAGACK